MKEVLYDMEEFKRLVDGQKRIHYDAHIEYIRRPSISAKLTFFMEGISKEGTIIKFERGKILTFYEVIKRAGERRKSEQRVSTNAYDDLQDLINESTGEWRKECQEKFNATAGRYDEGE